MDTHLAPEKKSSLLEDEHDIFYNSSRAFIQGEKEEQELLAENSLKVHLLPSLPVCIATGPGGRESISSGFFFVSLFCVFDWLFVFCFFPHEEYLEQSKKQ